MPNPKPAAEVAVGVDVVRALLAEQHPDLADAPMRLAAEGWDNAVVRIGDDLAARLPRREAAVPLVVHEQRWLPGLAARLPLPVPAPVRVGRPGAGYPWPWSVVPWLPGEVAAVTPPEDGEQAADALGSFLGALHRPAPPDAPENPVRGIPVADRAPTVVRNLTVARAAGVVGLGERFDAVWAAALAAPAWDGPPVWLHGDLHPANVLVHEGRLSAVVDFGDLTSGDPATDLAAAWLLLPADARARFWAAYAATAAHPVTDALVARAHGWAASLALSISVFSSDDPLMAGVGRRALAAVSAS